MAHIEIMAQRLRCFVAIEIPEAIQDQLSQIQATLQNRIQRASWVKPSNIHLTLKFLGEVDSNAIESIGPVLERVASHHTPFSLQVGGVGAFPNLVRPRVIWVGIKIGRGKVSALAQEIDQALTQYGFSLDKKKFKSHLTIARLKGREDLRPLVNLDCQYEDIDGMTMKAHEISLIQSQLHPKGAIYTTIQSYTLTL
jgi:2'-5' RNA ligase